MEEQHGWYFGGVEIALARYAICVTLSLDVVTIEEQNENGAAA